MRGAQTHERRGARAAQALAGTSVVSTRGLDNEIITGDYISQIVGVKIATPFFGTGFNFCIGAALPAPGPSRSWAAARRAAHRPHGRACEV